MILGDGVKFIGDPGFYLLLAIYLLTASAAGFIGAVRFKRKDSFFNSGPGSKCQALAFAALAFTCGVLYIRSGPWATLLLLEILWPVLGRGARLGIRFASRVNIRDNSQVRITEEGGIDSEPMGEPV